jgi:hypothetical protein
VIQLLKGHAEPTKDPLVSLTAHLTDPQDRETYAALISYFQSLPPGDELSRLAQLLGFLSLLGQRLPDALAEFLEVIGEQTKAAAKYHQSVDERLAHLPQEIAAGVDTRAIAKAMSEAFRQQLAATGLQDTATLLSASVAGLKSVSAEIAAAVKPLTHQYSNIGVRISTELAKLSAASAALQQHNANLVVEARRQRWLWKGLFASALFLVGGVCGILLEKGQTIDLIREMNVQLQRIQTPAVSAAASTSRNRRQ